MLLIWIALDYFLDARIWEGMTISRSAITVEYCEFNHPDRLFHQPINTYSNLVYFFLGMVVFQMGLFDLKHKQDQSLNSVIEFPHLSILTGICFMYLSIGSAFFHASLTWPGQRVDMNGTYGLTLSLLAIGLNAVFLKNNLSKRNQALIFTFSLLLILSFYQIALLVSSSILLPLLILGNLVLSIIHYFQKPKNKYISLAILSFILIIFALKIRTLDVQKVDCDPLSIWQGHALWHLLTGFSSFCTYAFFRFQKPNS